MEIFFSSFLRVKGKWTLSEESGNGVETGAKAFSAADEVEKGFLISCFNLDNLFLLFCLVVPGLKALERDFVFTAMNHVSIFKN